MAALVVAPQGRSDFLWLAQLVRPPRRASKAAQAVGSTSVDIAARNSNETSPGAVRFTKVGTRRSQSLQTLHGASADASVESDDSSGTSVRDSKTPRGTTLRKAAGGLKRRGSKTVADAPQKDMSAKDFMAHVMVDVEAAAALRAFMQAAVCEENIDFVFLVHEFRLAAESRARRIAAMITASYLLEEAPSVINVDARTRAAVLVAYREDRAGDAYQPISRTVFDLAFTKINALIVTDVIPRFFSSPQVGSCSCVVVWKVASRTHTLCTRSSLL